jgi:hypothetical protein
MILFIIPSRPRQTLLVPPPARYHTLTLRATRLVPLTTGRGASPGTRTPSDLTKFSDLVSRTIAHLNIQLIVSCGIEKAAATTVQPVVEPEKS